MKCGTNAGHAAHRRAKESPCEPCAAANKEYLRNRRHLYAGRYTEYNVQYRAEHPEKNRARVAKWRALNPDKSKDLTAKYHHARRARKASVESEFYTDSLLLKTYGTKCHLCNTEINLEAPRTTGLEGWELGLHIDHVIPLSAGGNDTISNVRPAHGKCNLSKPRKLFTNTSQ